MDAPLIPESGDASPPSPRSHSVAIAHDNKYQKAAALVDLAEDGIGLPEEVVLDDSKFGRASNMYFKFIRFEWIWTINLFALVILNFFEKPLWCRKYSERSCLDRKYYYLGELPYLNAWESIVYEVITLVLLAFYTLFPIAYEGWQVYWKNLLNKLKALFLVILIVDLLVYVLYLSHVGIEYLPFRISPYIRVAIFIVNRRELRVCMVVLGGMVWTYLNVLVNLNPCHLNFTISIFLYKDIIVKALSFHGHALGILYLLFFSWLAYALFIDTVQGKEVFYSYGVTLYQMMVLFTTSNNPDVWIPAYKKSRWSCTFFILYVLLDVYFITNLIFGVVYNSFKARFVKQIADADTKIYGILKKAFELIDIDDNNYLKKDQCFELFIELKKYSTLPKFSEKEFDYIFTQLDGDGDSRINMEEFADLCNAIAVVFQKEAAPSWFENYLVFYHAPSCEMFKTFIRGPVFGYVVTSVLVLNFIAVIIETTLDIQNNSRQIFWQKVEFFFGWIYVLEVLLKVFAMGFDSYWMEGQNRFDFIVTWIIVIGETTTFVLPHGVPFLSNGEWIRYLLIARMLRLIRILMHVQRCRAFVATFFTLIPSLMPYLGTIFCVMCWYCSLGLQIFGGLVNSGNSKLESTDLYDRNYTLLNFNDYPNGMVTLFNLLVMGNWPAWMQGYKVLTGTSWSLIYFISFYVIAVLLLLNLVVVFVLEAFFAEIDIETGRTQKPERKKILGIKTRSRRVDVLLHQMFSSELTEAQSSNSSSI